MQNISDCLLFTFKRIKRSRKAKVTIYRQH